MYYYTVLILYSIVPIPGYDDMGPIGQGLGEALESFSAHDYLMSRGKSFKAFEIIWQMPEQVVVFS